MADAVITSFGYLHGPPPAADITVDVRVHLRDPHPDPAMREATGLDEVVREHVLARGAPFAYGVAVTVDELLRVTATPPVRVAIGCAGGRHRSVVIAEEAGRRLRHFGWHVQVVHLHVDRPVVVR